MFYCLLYCNITFDCFRYSQAVYDSKFLPPPPTKPLPLAPGENIYAELGDCKKIAPENAYLEPVKSPEEDKTGKSRDDDAKQYEGLREEYVDMAGYEKMHKAQDVQTEETQKSESQQPAQTKHSTKRSDKLPRNMDT